jgi:hypothetical protein
MFDVVMASAFTRTRNFKAVFPLPIFGKRDVQVSRKKGCDNHYFNACRREFKRGYLREFKRGQILEGVFSEDFGPVVAGRAWWLGDRPELSERMMDAGD